MSLSVKKVVLRKSSPTREKIRSRLQTTVGMSRERFIQSPKPRHDPHDIMIKVENAFPSPKYQERSIRRPTSSVFVNSPISRCPPSPNIEEKEIQTLDEMSLTTSSDASLADATELNNRLAPYGQSSHGSACPPVAWFNVCQTSSAPSSVRRRPKLKSTGKRKTKEPWSAERVTVSRRQSMPVFTACTRRNLFKDSAQYEWEKVLAEEEDPFEERSRVERTPPSPIPAFAQHQGRGSLSLQLTESALTLFDSCSSPTSIRSDVLEMGDNFSTYASPSRRGTSPKRIAHSLNAPSAFLLDTSDCQPAAPPPSPMLPAIPSGHKDDRMYDPIPALTLSSPKDTIIATSRTGEVKATTTGSAVASKVDALCNSYNELRGLVLQVCTKQLNEEVQMLRLEKTSRSERKIDPEEILTWDANQVAQWVEHVNTRAERVDDFAMYAANIHQHDFCGVDLLSISRYGLLCLGVYKLGHQNAILRAFQSQVGQVGGENIQRKQKHEITRLTSELAETKRVLSETREFALEKTNQYHQAVKDHLDFLSVLQSKSAVFVKCIDDRWNCVRRTQKWVSEK